MANLGAVGISSRPKIMQLAFTANLIAVVVLPDTAGVVGVYGGYVYVK